MNASNGTYAQTSHDFRSKAELQVARCLDRHGIAYLHEHPLAVYDHQKVRIWYPDFTLPEYGLIIEYGGRLDDPRYAAGWARKKQVYAANGIDAIMLTPRDLRGDWPNHLLDSIETRLIKRMECFLAARHT